MCLPSSTPAQEENQRVYSRAEVRQSQDLLIVENRVLKIPATWSHPGGQILINNALGHDVTIPFLVNHRPETTKGLLKAFCVGTVAEPGEKDVKPLKRADSRKSTVDTADGSEPNSEGLRRSVDAEAEDQKLTEAFVEFVQEAQNDPAWFQVDWTYYARLCCWYATLLAGSFYFALTSDNDAFWTKTVLPAVLLGCYFQQIAFIGHDLGHNGLSHDRKLDSALGLLFGNTLSGIGIGWWKATHNVHHLVTNSVEYDCDIQHLPLFAITPKFFTGIFSHYHLFRFDLDAVSKFFLKRQHLLYYPIMALARFNLYAQTFIFVLGREYKMRMGDESFRLKELATLGVFWSWFSYLVAQQPTTGAKLAFLLISHAIAGLLHVQITISHFPMEVVDGNPLSRNFVKSQLQTSLDVDCPPWLDWFHGGLQFQAVHHLCPRIPRHNLRRFREQKLLPFCEQHGLQYQKMGFFACNYKVYRTLQETAHALHPFLLEGLNAAG